MTSMTFNQMVHRLTLAPWAHGLVKEPPRPHRVDTDGGRTSLRHRLGRR